jgi:hypothetical protein
MPGRIDAPRIDLVVALERGQNRIEEFEVAVRLLAGAVLPAGLFTFGIGQSAGRVQALHIDDDRSGQSW